MVTRTSGAQIVDLGRARVDRLADALTPILEAGHVTMSASSVDSIADWRTAARQAASTSGWRVRTGVTSDGSRVWAARIDRELTSEDDERLADRLGYLHAVLEKP